MYAQLSGEMAAPDGLIDEQRMAGKVARLIGLPDYTYCSEAVLGSTEAEDVHFFTGQPGTRLPHFWLDEAHLESTLNWIQEKFLLVVSGDSMDWNTAAKIFSNQSKIELLVHGITDQNLIENWQKLTTTETGDALLIRPDGFVACRLLAKYKVEGLDTTLKHILLKN